MKAIILAAGVGSRLLPFTKNLPKCMLKVGDKTIIEHQLLVLKKANVDQVVVVVGHQANKLKELLGNRVKFIDNKDYKSTNSSYSLWLARKELKDGFIHINSDLLFDFNLIQQLLSHDSDNGIIVDDIYDINNDMFKIRLDGNKIIEMGKDLKENVSAEAIGPVKFGSEGARVVINNIKKLIESGEKNKWAYEIFSKSASQISFQGIKNEGNFWIELDYPEDVKLAKKVFKNLYE